MAASTLVDAGIAQRFAARFAVEGPLDGSYLLDDLEAHFQALVTEAEPLIAAETRFNPGSAAVPVVLSRKQWATANVESMLVLMEPLLEKMERKLAGKPMPPLAQMAYGPALGAQLGVVLGFLSQRVLGQYDMLTGHENQVWFVGPNIVLTERKFGFVPRDFRLWVVLHELTHRAQFEGNPWMREYFLALIKDLLSDLDIDPKNALKRVAAPDDVAAQAPLALRVLSVDQLEKFNRLQAFMSLIEGHGNFVMDRIAENTIPTQPRMRQTLRSGAAAGGWLGKLIGKLLGFDLKRAQYYQGQAFLDAVLAAGGPDAVAQCFVSAEYLPSLAEVKDPKLWLARVRP